MHGCPMLIQAIRGEVLVTLIKVFEDPTNGWTSQGQNGIKKKWKCMEATNEITREFGQLLLSWPGRDSHHDHDSGTEPVMACP